MHIQCAPCLLLPSILLPEAYLLVYVQSSFVPVSVQAISGFWERHISSPVHAVDGARGRSGRILGYGEILWHSCAESCRRVQGEHGAFILSIWSSLKTGFKTEEFV